MKLYMHPLSNSSRPVLQLIAEHAIEVDTITIDILAGDQYEQAFGEINPSRKVPVFVDNDFVLTESAVIMGYLADVHELRDVYPDERRTRARIDELMSWFNTQFYQAAGYRLVYPQLFPHVAIGGSMDSAANRALIEHGRQETAKWFGVLENSLLGHGQDFLCGDTKTLADYLGAEHVAMTEWIGQSLGAYPRVGAWMKRCRGNGWDQVHAAHDSFLSSQHGKTFVTCP